MEMENAIEALKKSVCERNFEHFQKLIHIIPYSNEETVREFHLSFLLLLLFLSFFSFPF